MEEIVVDGRNASLTDSMDGADAVVVSNYCCGKIILSIFNARGYVCSQTVEGGDHMTGATIRLTMAQALVRWLTQQFTEIDGVRSPLFAGVFGIFGHGNVTCLSEALEAVQDRLPTWRGQNEQSMALAAIGFAKAKLRRQIMVATSSIGPGALNMVTAAGTAHANRLPLLLIAGDTFTNRLPDPVLQQVEHFGDPTVTVNDAFKAVSRYWDRITHPAQIISSLPQAAAAMLDLADCGPAFLALPQDTQEVAFDYPEVFFEPRTWAIPRPRPDRRKLAEAAALLKTAKKPILISGGGVRYSLAGNVVADFAVKRGIPIVETIAGKGAVTTITRPMRGRSELSAQPQRMRSQLKPMLSLRWVRAFRISRRAHGPPSARTHASSRSTLRGSMR